uniref:Uncharacterized protein n=1 Tax=Cacopsylla melanoneura TaxID=428564 RepID=A0A8D8RML3_9HEMI
MTLFQNKILYHTIGSSSHPSKLSSLLHLLLLHLTHEQTGRVSVLNPQMPHEWDECAEQQKLTFKIWTNQQRNTFPGISYYSQYKTFSKHKAHLFLFLVKC